MGVLMRWNINKITFHTVGANDFFWYSASPCDGIRDACSNVAQSQRAGSLFDIRERFSDTVVVGGVTVNAILLVRLVAT